MAPNPQAEELNGIITAVNPVILSLLSAKGKAIFFPQKGILGQTADAKGKAINATIGIALEEDGSPMRLASIACEIPAIDPKDAFPYAPSFGKPELRKRWKEMLAEKNPSLKGKCYSLPVVTHALTHALSMCGYLFINEGDELITPDLYWGNYNLCFKNAYGASFSMFPLFAGEGFNTSGLAEALKKGGSKKIVLLNFPNNPAGYAPTVKEDERIIAILPASAESGKHLVVLCDDAYFGLIYRRGIAEESLFAQLCDLHENLLAVKIDGATKEDYVWGLRVGFITYGIKGATPRLFEALEAKTAGAVRGSISNVSHLSQSLVLKAFTHPSYAKQKQEKYAILKKRCDAVISVLEHHPEYGECFTALPFNSGYFMCVALAEGIDSERVRQMLLKDYSTGVIALPGMLRLAFSACRTSDIPDLFENIYQACKSLKA